MEKITNENLAILLKNHLTRAVANRKYRLEIGYSSLVLTVPTEQGREVVGTLGLPVDIEETEEELRRLQEVARGFEREAEEAN